MKKRGGLFAPCNRQKDPATKGRPPLSVHSTDAKLKNLQSLRGIFGYRANDDPQRVNTVLALRKISNT